VAALELVLLAPFVLVGLWLIFLFGGSLLHKQAVIRADRSATWTHARTHAESRHTHDREIDPVYYPEMWTWVGDPTSDYYVTVHYYLPSETEPSVTADESEPAGGRGLLVSRVASAGYGPYNAQSAAILNRAAPVGYGTETWSLTATHRNGMLRYLGENVNRTITWDFRMDAGCWSRFSVARRDLLATLGGPVFEDALCEGLVADLVSSRLVIPRVATLFRFLSVMR
jgi:hypothetical protein